MVNSVFYTAYTSYVKICQNYVKIKITCQFSWGYTTVQKIKIKISKILFAHINCYLISNTP